MFSGIVEATGEVVRAEPHEGGVTLAVRAPRGFRDLEPGASVSVNGTCLTVAAVEDGILVFDAVGATLHRTLLGTVRPGDRLNLERSLRAGSPLDGHFVTGHVDGVGEITDRREGDGAVFLTIRAPERLIPQIVPRGSVAVDGVSLTVVGTEEDRFTVSIVPYTLALTIMGDYAVGGKVHLETDVLAKYVEGALKAGGRARRSPAPEDTEKVR